VLATVPPCNSLFPYTTLFRSQEMAIIFETTEIEDDEYKTYLDEMDPSYGAAMFGFMYTDNAVDILNELDSEQRENYLDMMDDERSEEHTSELQSRENLVCRLL